MLQRRKLLQEVIIIHVNSLLSFCFLCHAHVNVWILYFCQKESLLTVYKYFDQEFNCNLSKNMNEMFSHFLVK